MLHFNQDGTAGLDSSFQPLLPILTSNVTYAYSQSTPDGLDPALATSEFISEGRFTPTCQFITFSGPDVGSDYVSELDTIKEAIFLKLQDYIYEIKYTIVGEVFNPPRFYLVDPVLFRAYQAYDICGNSAVLHAKKGRLRLYGFSKYLVLWSPDELQISLKVTAKLQLSPTERSIRNPLVVGKHYVCVNNCPILVYENVYNKETSLLTRVVDPRSRKANKIIRKQYLANYKLGCLPELRVEGESAKNLQLPPPQLPR